METSYFPLNHGGWKSSANQVRETEDPTDLTGDRLVSRRIIFYNFPEAYDSS